MAQLAGLASTRSGISPAIGIVVLLGWVTVAGLGLRLLTTRRRPSATRPGARRRRPPSTGSRRSSRSNAIGRSTVVGPVLLGSGLVGWAAYLLAGSTPVGWLALLASVAATVIGQPALARRLREGDHSAPEIYPMAVLLAMTLPLAAVALLSG